LCSGNLVDFDETLQGNFLKLKPQGHVNRENDHQQSSQGITCICEHYQHLVDFTSIEKEHAIRTTHYHVCLTDKCVFVFLRCFISLQDQVSMKIQWHLPVRFASNSIT
jgi:hypothetical protein